MASVGYNAINPSNILTVGPVVIGSPDITNLTTNTIQPARGLFRVEINDTAAAPASLLHFVIFGGLSRQFGNPEAIYTVNTTSGLNSANLTVNDIGTAGTGNAQTTIVVTDDTTTSQYTLIYIPSTTGSTNLPTIQNTGGAGPGGNVNVSTTYLNCGPMGPIQSS